MYMDILKKIVNHYDYYKNIAVNLEWTELRTKYHDWYKQYPVGMFVTTFDFPENYVKDNFEQAYVQMVLTDMAHTENFEEGFQNVPSSELLEYMTQNVPFYAEYMTYEELRMTPVTEEYLIEKIKLHADRYAVPENEVNAVIPYIMGAENIEIGGHYYGDHTFISIKNNSIMLVECGIWD
ncbi:MAG: hypothetical protein K2H82_01825 [Oscillospiraceae bacterium]|nr:hypothetical protein [Oscillospiraceae bacterium]